MSRHFEPESVGASMSDMPSLFDAAPVARNSDPSTSWAAAALASTSAQTIRERCLAALKRAGVRGLTDFELAEQVGRQQTSAGVRRHELVKAGLVEATAETRPSPSGTAARVWRIR